MRGRRRDAAALSRPHPSAWRSSGTRSRSVSLPTYRGLRSVSSDASLMPLRIVLKPSVSVLAARGARGTRRVTTTLALDVLADRDPAVDEAARCCIIVALVVEGGHDWRSEGGGDGGRARESKDKRRESEGKKKTKSLDPRAKEEARVCCRVARFVLFRTRRFCARAGSRGRGRDLSTSGGAEREREGGRGRERGRLEGGEQQRREPPPSSSPSPPAPFCTGPRSPRPPIQAHQEGRDEG